MTRPLRYLITGAAGHLGLALVSELLARKQNVRVLLLPNDPFPYEDQVEVVRGDELDPRALDTFFSNPEDEDFYLVHAAGIVSISSKFDQRVYDVNVKGSEAVLDHAFASGVKKTVYVSSVHAIPERKKGQTIVENPDFDPQAVKGLYAQTKAEASAYALTLANHGLNLMIVHPSGIIGPYDKGRSHLIALLKDYYTGRLKAAVKGGYDFVDVRDVVNGILACFVSGESGECYILSGSYHTIKELLGAASQVTGQPPIKTYLPYGLARFIAPLEEAWYRKRKIPPLYTAYSLYTLRSNANFSHAKATEQLHYVPRPLFETIKDSYDYLFTHGALTPKEPHGQI